GKKIVKFFLDLKSELKKVVWPDRKKLTQSTITVLMICLMMAVLVFVIDKVLSGTLNAVGFFPDTSSAAASNILPTAAPTSAASAVSSAVDSAASSVAASSQAASSAAASSQG
ncbi:MAG: preprotein translocase subunit SecE, partial [Saccharofermentanales bacterium]